MKTRNLGINVKEKYKKTPTTDLLAAIILTLFFSHFLYLLPTKSFLLSSCSSLIFLFYSLPFIQHFPLLSRSFPTSLFYSRFLHLPLLTFFFVNLSVIPFLSLFITPTPYLPLSPYVRVNLTQRHLRRLTVSI